MGAPARFVWTGRPDTVALGREANPAGFFAKTFREHWAISRHREQGLLNWTRSVLRSRARTVPSDLPH
jgi:hypothetical protein